MNKLTGVLLSLCLLASAGAASAQDRYTSTLRAIRAGVMANGNKFSRIAAREFFADHLSLSVAEFKTADAIRSGLLAHGVQESLRLSEQYRSNLNKFWKSSGSWIFFCAIRCWSRKTFLRWK